MPQNTNKIDSDEILDFCIMENRLIYYAKYNFGDFYELAIDTLDLTKCIKDLDKKGNIFAHFVIHVSNAFFMTIVSTIRRHTIQANMMLRQALESSVLAVYSLSNNKIADFGSIEKENAHEFLKPNDKITDKAYDWIEKNYKNYSDYIKERKKAINDLFSHSNIVIIQTVIRESENKISGLKFDSEKDEYILGELVTISELILHILNMFVVINKDFKLINFINDFEEKIDNQFKKIEILKKKLLKMPVFKQFLDKNNII